MYLAISLAVSTVVTIYMLSTLYIVVMLTNSCPGSTKALSVRQANWLVGWLLFPILYLVGYRLWYVTIPGNRQRPFLSTREIFPWDSIDYVEANGVFIVI